MNFEQKLMISIKKTIEDMGLEELKKISWFMSNRKVS